MAALTLLAADSVVHFDLKCANVLVDPLPGVKDGELWGATGPLPPFQVGGSEGGQDTAGHKYY